MNFFKKQGNTLEKKIYLSILSTILLTVFICTIGPIFLSIKTQIGIVDDNLMMLSESLSISPSVLNSAASGCATNSCRNFLDSMSEKTSMMDLIEIIDINGTCIYRTDHLQIGEILDAHIVPEDQRDKTVFDNRFDLDGNRYRFCRTPIRISDGTVLGYITVSVPLSRLNLNALQVSIIYLLAAVVLLFGGGLIASAQFRSIRKILRGYAPDQLMKMFDGNTNVLDSIDEGVIAINLEGRVTTINQFGREILGLPVIPYDRVLINDLLPDSCLMEVLKTEHAHYNEHIVIHGKNLLVTHLPLYSNGKLIGAASLFHNAKIINEMAEQLQDANSLIDTFRAFNHEFMNKLHVILGYLETDHIQEAKDYLLHTSMSSSRAISQIARIITHQGMAALIIGKFVRAEELNITFQLTPESYCSQLTEGVAINTYITILGNLLQNAIEELNAFDHPLKEIQLSVLVDSESTYISVLDTGRGIPQELIDHITTAGISTKGEGRGTGLNLVHNLVSGLNGSLKIESDPGEGTVITVLFKSPRNAKHKKEEGME